VNQKSFLELQFIDAGYGYTFDGGKTFPFRDKGFKISLLSEFYALYPTHRFWLNLKNNDEYSFHLLNTYLSNVDLVLPDKTMVITTPKGVDWFKVNSATVKTASVESVKRCLFLDWLGWVGA
jgi:glycerophosphoryl diester phosphodiesterase